jgi:hypothetical protein
MRRTCPDLVGQVAASLHAYIACGPHTKVRWCAVCSVCLTYAAVVSAEPSPHPNDREFFHTQWTDAHTCKQYSSSVSTTATYVCTSVCFVETVTESVLMFLFPSYYPQHAVVGRSCSLERYCSAATDNLQRI